MLDTEAIWLQAKHMGTTMADYDFHAEYQGPLGPHLNHVSRYTLTRKDEHRLIGRAIRGAGKNTSAASTGRRQARAIVGLQGHLTRHPRDMQSETHLLALGGKRVEA